MKRRFIAAAVLIGILLIGVFTTVITRNFVSSQAEKVTTDSVVSRNDPDTPGNIVLSRNETNIGISSAMPQMPLDEKNEENDISEPDTYDPAESETEPEDSVSVSETETAVGETSASEPETVSSISETQEQADESPAVNFIAPQVPNGPSTVDGSVNDSSGNDPSDGTVISQIGSSGPGDYVSITPLDTAAADIENEDTSPSVPGNGNVTAVGDTAEPAETVKSPLDGASTQAVASSSVTNEDLRTRLAAAEEKTSSDPVSPQAAEYDLNLWNYEMNYIADTLRSLMDYDSAESLLQEQLKFLKDRDTAYDSGAMANRAQTETDTSYIVEAMEKTRDRCYYLLDTYGDILD